MANSCMSRETVYWCVSVCVRVDSSREAKVDMDSLVACSLSNNPPAKYTVCCVVVLYI